MKYYYFVDNNRSRQGPFPIEELLSHGVTPDTLIWCKGMDKWEKAKEVPEIAILFIKVKPPVASINQQSGVPRPSSSEHTEIIETKERADKKRIGIVAGIVGTVIVGIVVFIVLHSANKEKRIPYEQQTRYEQQMPKQTDQREIERNQQERQASDNASPLNTNALFPYESYFLGLIGSKGVLAIDNSGGGYCTYNHNGTDLTRNIKVDHYDRSTGRLRINAYDRQGNYVGQLNGYTKNNNSYVGTFTSKKEGTIMEFNLQVSSQSNKSNNSSGRYVVIDGSELRLRYGPSLSSDTFKWPDGHNRHPNVGERFKYLGESGDFYKIDFNGHILWVSKQHTHRE